MEYKEFDTFNLAKAYLPDLASAEQHMVVETEDGEPLVNFTDFRIVIYSPTSQPETYEGYSPEDKLVSVDGKEWFVYGFDPYEDELPHALDFSFLNQSYPKQLWKPYGR
jgi:hypothetical protein